MRKYGVSKVNIVKEHQNLMCQKVKRFQVKDEDIKCVKDEPYEQTFQWSSTIIVVLNSYG